MTVLIMARVCFSVEQQFYVEYWLVVGEKSNQYEHSLLLADNVNVKLSTSEQSPSQYAYLYPEKEQLQSKH